MNEFSQHEVVTLALYTNSWLATVDCSEFLNKVSATFKPSIVFLFLYCI